MVKEKPSHYLIIAHRGNSSEAPENSVAAVQQAIDLNADCVEIDVHLSSDGIPVVIHDDTLLRTAGIRHHSAVHALPYATLKEISIGTRFGNAYASETIPRLRDLLQLKWHRTRLMIEIKEGPQSPQTIVDALIQEIGSVHHPLPELIIGSFSLEIWSGVNRRLQELPKATGTIAIVEQTGALNAFIEQGAKRIAMWSEIADVTTMEKLKENGIETWCFTVDSLLVANRLVQYGAAGIITNTPRQFLK